MAVLQQGNEATILVHEVTYASGSKRVSVMCDDIDEVRGMVEKFLHASSPGSSGGSDHEPSLRITRKAMSRKEFDALEDWDGGGGGGGDKAGKEVRPAP